MPVRKDSVRVFVFRALQQKGNAMKKQVARVPIAVVAEKLNTTPLNVLMHIKRGLLTGIEEDGGWRVDCHSLDALLAKTGGSKAEDVCASSCAKQHACSSRCS